MCGKCVGQIYFEKIKSSFYQKKIHYKKIHYKKIHYKKIHYKKVHFVYDNSHTLLRIMLYSK
jgi:hypothetical protein